MGAFLSSMTALQILLVSVALAQRPAAPEETPGAPPAHYRDPGAAAETLIRLVTDEPDRAEWRWRLAMALVDAGKVLPDRQRPERDSIYARAVSAAWEAIRLAPDGAQGHFALAAALGRATLTRGIRDRIRDAEAIRTAALRALELDPGHDGAWHVLGRWHAEIMRLSGLERFIARRILGGGILGEASWDQAVHGLDQAVALRPDWIYHRLDLAEVLIKAGRPEAARPHLEAIAGLAPVDPLDPEYRATAAELLRKLRGGSREP
ncbi:MAG: hypothetical protein AABY91_05675 [Gemmatimonadota bacterium]